MNIIGHSIKVKALRKKISKLKKNKESSTKIEYYLRKKRWHLDQIRLKKLKKKE